MNKEELKELAAVLNGIAEGKEWLVTDRGSRTEAWEEYCSDNPISAIENGYKIRLKPQPPPLDPYAEIKAAHAAGKVIQHRFPGYLDWNDTSHPEFLRSREYRIKPEQKKVPLEPGDVPPGSVFSAMPEASGYCVPSLVDEDGCLFASRSSDDYQDKMVTWSDMVYGWWIWRPTDTEWQPCYKKI